MVSDVKSGTALSGQRSLNIVNYEQIVRAWK